MKTYRVTVRVTGLQTFEVNASSEADARECFAMGRLIYDDLDDEVESVVEIDIAPDSTEGKQ